MGRQRGILQPPIEIDGHGFDYLLQYLGQLRLILVDEPPLVHGRIVRYDVKRIIPGDAVREGIHRPLVIHDRERGYPAPQGIVRADLVALVAACVDLVGYVERVLRESTSDVTVLVGAVTGREDYRPIGVGILEDGPGAYVGMVVEEEEDAARGALDYASVWPVRITDLLRQLLRIANLLLLGRRLRRHGRRLRRRGIRPTTGTTTRIINILLLRKTFVDRKGPPRRAPTIARDVRGTYAILPPPAGERRESLEG
mmetsp:Transcript_3578/g.9144  ORF Transcript_3578/g.9144 Transcript_3578/m.9144 type:complete len:255 (+) Transcript_3578:535-1299(+)